MDATARSAASDRLSRLISFVQRKRRLRRAPLIERRPISPLLAVYVGIVITVGFSVLFVVTAVGHIRPGLTNPGLPVILADPEANALLFWIVFGLFGSTRARSIGGRAVLTFHLPFIVAAMTLGGPVAAGWVGAISSIELRELREVPWFGTLYNHAVTTLGAVIGGIVGVMLRATLVTLVEPQAAYFVAALGAAFVFCTINVGLTVVMVGAREGMTLGEAGALIDRSFRQTTIAEVILGWVLAISYTTIAWWAPIACSALVLLAWRANDEHELSTHDRLTGLLNRRGWDTRWSETLRRVQRGRQRAAVLMIDLDGFKAINDTYTHDAGDDVLRETGTRLRAALRYTDVAARFGGDEFAALLLGVPDAATAKGIVARLHEELTAPVPVMVEGVRREVAIGASIGLVYLDQPTAAEAFGAADSAMFEVKRRGGGVGLGGQIEAAAVT